MFSFALISELLYYIFARIYTASIHWKLNDHKSKFHRIITSISHVIVTILPSDMLVFFGYNDGINDIFKTKWLNMAWGRRIVSVIRILV